MGIAFVGLLLVCFLVGQPHHASCLFYGTTMDQRFKDFTTDRLSAMRKCVKQLNPLGSYDIPYLSLDTEPNPKAHIEDLLQRYIEAVDRFKNPKGYQVEVMRRFSDEFLRFIYVIQAHFPEVVVRDSMYTILEEGTGRLKRDQVGLHMFDHVFTKHGKLYLDGYLPRSNHKAKFTFAPPASGAKITHYGEVRENRTLVELQWIDAKEILYQVVGTRENILWIALTVAPRSDTLDLIREDLFYPHLWFLTKTACIYVFIGVLVYAFSERVHIDLKSPDVVHDTLQERQGRKGRLALEASQDWASATWMHVKNFRQWLTLRNKERPGGASVVPEPGSTQPKIGSTGPSTSTKSKVHTGSFVGGGASRGGIGLGGFDSSSGPRRPNRFNK